MPINSGYSAREIPFYGLPSSKIVSAAPTAHDAMVLAGLDWHVDLEPTYQDMGEGIYRPVPDRFLTVRQDTRQVLGNVGKIYTPFQNADAFSFADELLGFGVEFDAAAAYDNNRKVFLTAKLPNGLTVPDTDDKMDLFLLFKTSHDGSSAITAMITPIRLSCTNMMNLALRSAIGKWTARHTSSVSDRITEATRTLNLVDAYSLEFEATAALLKDIDVNLDGFKSLVEQVTDSPRLQEGMTTTWRTSPTVDRSSGWGALNAIGEYMEHNRGGKGNIDSRFDSNLDGQTANTRNRALQLLVRR